MRGRLGDLPDETAAPKCRRSQLPEDATVSAQGPGRRYGLCRAYEVGYI
jgi:hypothetical protein